MKTEEIILNNFQLKYPLERLALLSDILFLDIETTGFLTGSSSIYLIGCAYYEDGNWKLRPCGLHRRPMKKVRFYLRSLPSQSLIPI